MRKGTVEVISLIFRGSLPFRVGEPQLMPINFSLFKQKLKELELQAIEQLKEMFAEVFQVYQKDIQSFEANLWGTYGSACLTLLRKKNT